MDKDSQVYKIRHSLAHVLADAVLELYPHAKCGSGPATEEGFFYGFDFSGGETPGEDDLKTIEKKMRHLLKQSVVPEQETITTEEALERFKESPYKVEILKEKGEKNNNEISVYTVGKFSDPCSGPHVAATKEINKKAFRLERIAGAYWKGDEKNPMLTRIYGLAFEDAEGLAEYDKMQKEAKERDHRKIGKELDLFTFSDLVGSGLPLFTPKGTLLRNLVVDKIYSIQEKYGYERVWIPHIAKKDLYKKSGHWEKFGEELFKVKGKTDVEFVMKPMNCPHHTQIYASKPRSYKDLPIRYTEATTNYRDEQPGELLGLSRVRSLTQDDGHVFCTMEQVENEVQNIIDVIRSFYTSLGMFNDETYWVSLSVRDQKLQDEYLGESSVWDTAENILEEVAKKENLNYKRIEGEAAFYGPKLDFMFKDAIGREWQLGTVQLDLNMPGRFGLEYTDKDGTKKTPVMIHRAIAGSLERFLSVIIEHFAGNFPLWLSPEQIRVIPVADTHTEYATQVFNELKAIGIRATMDDSSESMGKKIRVAKTDKLPYFVVVGDKEVEAKNVTLESRNGDSKQISLSELGNHLLAEIETKTI